MASADDADAAVDADCQPCEEYDPLVDYRRRKVSPLGSTAFAFVEVQDEPAHVTILLTQCLRVMRLCKFPGKHPHIPTEWHRHAIDSLYLFLADAAAHAQTDKQDAPQIINAKAEAAFYAPHSSAPLIHQGERSMQNLHLIAA